MGLTTSERMYSMKFSGAPQPPSPTSQLLLWANQFRPSGWRGSAGSRHSVPHPVAKSRRKSLPRSEAEEGAPCSSKTNVPDRANY